MEIAGQRQFHQTRHRVLSARKECARLLVGGADVRCVVNHLIVGVEASAAATAGTAAAVRIALVGASTGERGKRLQQSGR